jgi:hypothetical protein
MDMVVNVGLGTGNKDQQLVHLQQITMAQLEAVKAGGMGLLVTPQNIYNAQAKIVENAGFKNVEDFWTDPGDQMPEPQPDPQAELEKQKAEMDMQAKEHELQLKQRSANQEFAHKERMAQLDYAVETQKMGIEQKKMQMGLDHERERARFDLSVKGTMAEQDMTYRAKDEERKAEPRLESVADTLMQALQAIQQTQAQLAEGLQQVAQIAGADRETEAIRDPKTGSLIGGRSRVAK